MIRFGDPVDPRIVGDINVLRGDVDEKIFHVDALLVVIVAWMILVSGAVIYLLFLGT